MLRVLPLTFRFRRLMWVVKRTTSPFNTFCSNVAKQVVRLLLPVFPYLRVLTRSLLVTGKTQSLPPPPPPTLRPGIEEEGEGRGGGGGEGIGICNCRSPRRHTTLEKRSREAWEKNSCPRSTNASKVRVY